MIKALILAYDFPPYTSVGGQRPFNWYKHFKDFGIYPIVITRQWSSKYGNNLDYISPGDSDLEITEETEHGRIIRTPYHPNLANRLYIKYGANKKRIIRKTISAYFEYFQWAFNIGPKSKLFHSALNFLKTNKVDIIIATGEPFILFRYASILGKKFSIKWIADYRDPWTEDKTRYSNIVQIKLFSYMERKFVSNAVLVTTVSQFFKNQISSNLTSSRIEIICNGFDNENINKTRQIAQNKDCLTISFVGTIYKWNPWQLFLNTLDYYISQKNKNIRINFYGTNISKEIEKELLQLPSLHSKVFFFPNIENKLLLIELAKTNVLLLFNYYSFLGTKIYDYLALKRKILLCFTNDPNANVLKKYNYCLDEIGNSSNKLQEELLIKTNSGIPVKDTAHLNNILDLLYNEFDEKKSIECNSLYVENYSRKKQTEALAKLIKQVVNSK